MSAPESIVDRHNTDDPASCWCSPVRMEPGLWVHQDDEVPEHLGYVIPVVPDAQGPSPAL